jgi:hypothetical protein
VARKSPLKRPPDFFTLGGEQAEADPLLQTGFYESSHYRALAARDEPRCFVIGRTGSGKSAALQRLEEQHRGHVVRITPEDLSLPYLTELGALQYLASLNVHLDPLFIALWKHVLLIEVIKHRYNIDSPAEKQTFLESLRERIKRDHSKAAALDYLDEFEGRFWCETDERVREITNRFEQQVQEEAGGRLAAPGVGEAAAKVGSGTASVQEVRVEQADRFQRIVNSTQLPRLNKMMSVLDEDILDSEQNYTYVVVDDLDRDWIDDTVANALVRCLFRAVVDLKRVRNMKVLVALRTNMLEQLDFGSRTGGQEEKFRALTMRMRWTRAELEAVLSERAVAAANKNGLTNIRSIRDLVPATNKTRGDALEYILRRTLMRPRDAVAYFNEALVLAGGKPRVAWEQIHAAELPYSQKRLLALRDEWKPSYPGLDDVLALFRGAPVRMSRSETSRILDDAAMLPAERGFAGVRWMTQMGGQLVEASGDRTWGELYHPLVRFLFNVGFLGLAGEGERAKYVYDEPTYADSPKTVEAAISFFVHPAFRPALDIQHARGKDAEDD